MPVLSACDDKSGDTGDPVDEDVETSAPGTLDPLGGKWEEIDDSCWITSGGHVALDENIRRWEVDGLTGSRTPPVDGVRAHRTTGPCAPAASGWCSSGGTTEPDEAWTTAGTGCSSETSDTGYLSFTNCWGTGYASGEDPCGAGDSTSCDGEYAVEITKGSAGFCEDYDPVRIELELMGSSARSVSPRSTCLAGSGRFLLWPKRMQDRDEDGRFQVSFLPMQVSGTGRMTRAAWVTEITVVSDQGHPLRVIKADQDFWFDGADHLVDPSSRSVALSGTTRFATGVIGGMPPFVSDEIDLDDRWSLYVDMTWSCGTGATEVSGLSTGYVLSLDDIGCPAVQDLVLRHDTSPNRVKIEPYGHPMAGIVRPTTTVADGERFTYDWNYLHLDAVLLSHDETRARLRIDELTWDGTTVCVPGTYTLPVE